MNEHHLYKSYHEMYKHGVYMYISKSKIKKMLKDAGAERVSDSAAKSFQDSLNKFAFGVAKKSVKFCNHAKRKTVEESDIKLALQ